MIVFADHELPVVVASYVLTGRFNPQHQLEQHPTARAAEIGRELQLAKTAQDKTRAKKLEMDENLERARVVGTAEEWKEYREAFDRITAEAIPEELIADSQRLHRYFKNLDLRGTPLVDEHGALWMEIRESGREFKVGLSANNILAPASDSLGAYELLLARTNTILKSPKHSRESMLEFRRDWAVQQRASERSAVSVARNAIPGKAGRTMFLSDAGDDSLPHWLGLQRATSSSPGLQNPLVKAIHVNLFKDWVTRWRYPVLLGAISNESAIPPVSKRSDRIRFRCGTSRRRGHTRDTDRTRSDGFHSRI